MYSAFLTSRHDLARKLVDRLSLKFDYVSVLGKHITGDTVRVTNSVISVGETFEKQCGFVAKIYNGSVYCEYAFSDITEDTLDTLEQEITESTKLSPEISGRHMQMAPINEEELKAEYARPIEGRELVIPEIIEKLTALKDELLARDERIVQAVMHYEIYDVSAMFLSQKKDLTQNYGWVTIVGMAAARDKNKIQRGHKFAVGNHREEVFDRMRTYIPEIAREAIMLLDAEMITPGVYDIITDPAVSGLIAHEAFGHGVEMDMFVKHRANSRHFLGKEVASPLVSMRDGAASVESCVGYFFDDDGVAAHDTLIIKDGILQTGISDAVSALILGTEPTGNGRRQDPGHKSYTRMTNTFFMPGKDKVEDMIRSVDYGYMICECSNGMEDPKNWNIQCVAGYGREIKNGQFTGKVVAPVVMSGYVPDLLKSITMVSDEWEVLGAGHCGKGYKEIVPVSDGGPYLKARCKLG